MSRDIKDSHKELNKLKIIDTSVLIFPYLLVYASVCLLMSFITLGLAVLILKFLTNYLISARQEGHLSFALCLDYQ